MLATGLILEGWIVSLRASPEKNARSLDLPPPLWGRVGVGGHGFGRIFFCIPLRRPGRRIVALWGLATLALLLVWPFTEAGRFLVPLVPALLVGAVEGLSAVLARIGFRRQARRWAVALILIVSVPYSVHSVQTHRPWSPDPFDQACLWLSKNAASTATVLTHHPAELYWQSGHQAWTPDDDVNLDDPASLARRQIDYLVVEPGPPDDPLRRFVESQPHRVRLKMSAGTGPGVRVYQGAW